MKANQRARGFIKEDSGVLNIGTGLAVVGIILTAVITMVIAASLLPTFADAVADVNTNLTDANVTWGDTTTDSLADVFPIVIGITALIGFIGVILGVFSGRLGGP